MTERLMTPVLYPPEGGSTGDLLSVSNDFMGISQLQAVSKLLYKQGECRVWFADVVQKVGRRGELKPKALVVTSKSLYFLQPGSYTIRTKVPIFGVEEVKMSRFRDNFIAIFHSCIEKDHLLVTTRREVLANCMMDARGRDGGPMLEYTSAFVHRLDAHTVREVSFYEDEDMIIHTKLVTKPGPDPTLTTAATPTFPTTPPPDAQTSG